MNKLWISIIIAPIFSAILVAIHLTIIFHENYNGPDSIFKIAHGEGFASINYRLNKEGLVNNPRLFHYYAKFNNVISKFKAGPYKIKNGMHMGDIMELLVNGQAITTAITIPEGKNIYEIADILEKFKICSKSKFLILTKDHSLLRENNLYSEVSTEGYLYPDTYNFSPSTPARKVITTMLRVFNEKVQSLDFSKSHLSKREVIILASIVEKETGAEFERPIIAGVYLNRLKKNMRLYSDPTTIYGVFETYNGNLKKKHLQQRTPYNTYRINGLPKGPIANPGLESIKAVLSPKIHNHLYFVSRNDGTHEFTETYKEHLLAVKKYQQTRANRVGKSWRDLQK